ncbi:glucose-6-phosphate dehydrogenase assembly protein OpcA [Corynebacterium felinum]|uniref:Glucose-6-phosphate dehydrogenase assembly protein OpcA n=1 Tax=Corynebacterium felinum TaxID=131318 RepID=A0ABU2BAQ8_9CORY|nr:MULTISPECIES: glucose-6-phosphate dehydrogenase assembly protein OpcA [Corynebacterium]MDF5821977.1 glucose-6-phosphate dehydrogenase assembly protein OpcA [Corynebacterium felinum]MDO4760381.1 glucose-6-phosphate dehydrogenase assembly protein OpcA [Corynebacterium sp.]MDR7355727.1 glucose-6-phosphate dehydrogenase assembly protein OpcA [Corynebacterium felinum]WJY95075.1 Glucose-6-phosphate dehydrogenase subunit [Corynebacterium felinum]
MIFELPNSDTREIAKTLVRIRDNGVQSTTSRVLTLIVVAKATDDLSAVIDAAKDASREHPSRVIVLVTGDAHAEHRLDAEVRIGGDAGAAELIVIRLNGEVVHHLVHVVTPLLLPDTPIVVWWPFTAPVHPSEDQLGKIAQRRITDAEFDPLVDALYNRRNAYAPGDSDISWARLTPWRGVLASALDQPPHEMVVEAKVYGPASSPSVDLAAGWLVDRLGVTVTRMITPESQQHCGCSKRRNVVPVMRAELIRPSGTIVLEACDHNETIAVTMPGRATAKVAVNLRTEADCLAEELRHLDPDSAYERALHGLTRVYYPVV